MDKICPVCNGLESIFLSCPRCGEPMMEEGALANFLGPYSPYQEQDLLDQNNGIIVEGPDPCIHLLSCKNCQVESRFLVERIPV